MADAVLFTGRILLQDQNGEGIITKVFSNQSVVPQTLQNRISAASDRFGRRDQQGRHSAAKDLADF